MSDPILAARGVRVVREGRALLDAVDVSIERGTVHAIIGPNGGGKSTLVSALLGHTDFSGEVKLFLREGASSAPRIGYVPQAFPVDRTLPVTVAEFLALRRQRRPICLGVKRDVRTTIDALLERVGLGGFGRRRLGALSGGELQRVLVANAIDPQPDLLFLDEPASGLDQSALARVEDCLVELRAAGSSAVLVSHDPLQVKRLADSVTWIDVRVQKSGSVTDVMGEDAHFPFSRRAS